MAVATLTIDLNAVLQNWRALDALSGKAVKTGAVIKANGYGLDAAIVAQKLHANGVNHFFVAAAEEGIAVRNAIGKNAEIYVFSGCCESDKNILQTYALTPLLNSVEQVKRFLPQNLPFGIQLDTGMNRLGLEPNDWMSLKDEVLAQSPRLIMSHLACADEPDHPQNPAQLSVFKSMTKGVTTPRSLSATGGTLLGPEYHFDMTRPGVGLYGGMPFADAVAVVETEIPVIQTREVSMGETVGYAAHWPATKTSKIATIAAGYADGLNRAMGNGTVYLFAGETPCPLVGRVSMDLLTVDVTHLETIPNSLTLLNSTQTVDDLATAAGTIGYEILTSLGGRYKRVYKNR